MEAHATSKDAPAPDPNHHGALSKTDEHAEASPEEPPSTWYQVIMTAINFTSFILSLLLVDIRYSLRRTHYHTASPSRLPPWIRNMIYRSKSPENTCSKEKSHGKTDGSEELYYHSKQKKLMKMEAEEAFKLRNTVVALSFAMIVLAIGLGWMGLEHVWKHWIMGHGG